MATLDFSNFDTRVAVIRVADITKIVTRHAAIRPAAFQDADPRVAGINIAAVRAAVTRDAVTRKVDTRAADMTNIVTKIRPDGTADIGIPNIGNPPDGSLILLTG